MPRTTKNKPEKPQIGIYSHKIGKIVGSQFEFDLLSFRDPAGQKQFTNMNGSYPAVRDWVKQDKRFPSLVQDCLLIADDLIKDKVREGKTVPAVCSWLSFSFKDYHGKWASVAVTELVADALSDAGYLVSVYHSGIPEEAVWTPI